MPDASATSVSELASEVEQVGFAACSGVVGPDEVDGLRTMVDAAAAADLELAPEDRRDDARGRVLFLPQHDPAFLELLEDPRLMEPIEAVLGSDCTLFTMTTLCRDPGEEGMALHRDSKVDAPGFVAAMGALVLLDDLDHDVGATRLYPERTTEQPSIDDFQERCRHLIAPAGSVCWFDGRVWHDVPENRSNRRRRVLIIAMARPWVRPRFDNARMLAHVDFAALNPRVQAKLGFDHLLPGSAAEYFLPAEERRSVLLARATQGSGPLHRPQVR